MSAATNGTIGVHVTAGHIHPIDSLAANEYIGQGFYMGDAHDLTIHFKPETARQWIAALQTIASTREDNA